ncbi:iron-containing redox enzyme family protein [Paraburkholderia sp. RP-4-7]|uniref:Iron-containing redox enzyme family protein n=1 Tax=Paraburkholderia polaris TaxID=2728848 RepID=A0A848IHX5_9BURK|nr:iron-containing redox enzyme family protein [Paraburkholderia polaris]NMM00336.1 iron-containing redox enzyme family protein [Paraburkholderia polaris]
MNASCMFSPILRKKLALGYPFLAQTTAHLFSGNAPERVFANYLMVLHGLIRASVPVMKAAAACIQKTHRSGSDDLVLSYLITHIDEETGHDDWLIDDLAALGVERQEVEKYLPSVPVASLVGMQYYWIHHYNPLVVLGYIAAMEGNPPNRAALDAMRLANDFPFASMRTLYMHSDADQQHMLALDKVLDQICVDTELRDAITMNALCTLDYAAAAFLFSARGVFPL